MGKAVVFLRMNAVRDSAGREFMDSTVISYTKVDDRVLSGIASLFRSLIEGIVTRKLSKAVETVDRLGLVMRQNPERVLSKAMAPPAFADTDVAFLKMAFAGPQKVEHTGDDTHLRP